MYTYPWYHWITFFYIYCFFGWIFESTYVSLRKRRFINRGFLCLPMLPLYGTGAVMMLWVSLPVKENLSLVYLLGVSAATALEYVTGYVMERLFKIKYWDYSDQKFQLHGYICLTSSIAWGFLTILLTEVIHRPIARLVLALDPALEFSLLILISGAFLLDTVQSTKEALALGRALESMSRIKAELDELHAQTALLRAGTRMRAAELRASVIRQTTQLREEAAALISHGKDREAALLAGRIRSLAGQRRRLLEARRKLSSHLSFYRKGLLQRNPSASSRKFAEALQELKELLEQK